ncbi:MAG: DUF4350 domain-containing protein [Flavobacterium sp.]|uniref:DUF4350 domain-containing protein n=1 Tax=Flavobacterium sp. TaxID=239 RepID=UPI001201B4A5|nr:DUF4350 domain-containing protein [Flavobacterium sp.]RZJ64500.1 MAG: DUF4350 domain-containing protein [Flavobacterium sp.]
MGKLKILIGFLVLVFVLMIVLDGGQPKEVNWKPTYGVKDKNPLGLYVFDQEIGRLTNDTIERIRVTPYEFFDTKYDTLAKTYKIKGTFLNISNAENLDNESLKEVFYFVSHGNSAFLSLSNFLVEGVNPIYFSSIDTASTTILGYTSLDSLRANFVKVDYRGGTFYLHTAPAAFTNFHLLKDDHHEYAEKLLSYLPKGKIYWFNKQPGDESISESELRYIFSQPALTWAWLMFLFGMLAFMIFQARRKQRIVPILEPLPNTTVEFAKTIGNLYYQEGDHHTVIDRKIIYFLEKIRTDYLIDTTKLDDAFTRKLQQKSGKPMADIEHALFLIRAHRNSPHTAVEEDLIKINTALEKIIH